MLGYLCQGIWKFRCDRGRTGRSCGYIPAVLDNKIVGRWQVKYIKIIFNGWLLNVNKFQKKLVQSKLNPGPTIFEYQDLTNLIFEQIKINNDSTFWRVFADFLNKRCTLEFISINQGGPMCRVTSRQSKNILFLKWVPRDDQQF